MFGPGHLQPRPKIRCGVDIAVIARHPPDRDKARRLAGQRRRDETDAPVSRDDYVEGAVAERGFDRLAEMGVAVDMRDFRHNLGNLVRSTMDNCDLLTSFTKPVV